MSSTTLHEPNIDHSRYDMLGGEDLWEIAKIVVNAREMYHTPPGRSVRKQISNLRAR
jgi:hypothetical protein